MVILHSLLFIEIHLHTCIATEKRHYCKKHFFNKSKYFVGLMLSQPFFC